MLPALPKASVPASTDTVLAPPKASVPLTDRVAPAAFRVRLSIVSVSPPLMDTV
jgi:hypothetical protein